MAVPSSLQIAVLMISGALMAGFGCFYTADSASALGAVVFLIGLVALAYVGVRLAARRTVDAVAPPAATEPAATVTPRPAAQPRPTVPQSIALAFCGFLLFFFSCGGLLLLTERRMSHLGFLTPVTAIGMIGGGVFGITAIVLFILALVRRTSSAPKPDLPQ